MNEVIWYVEVKFFGEWREHFVSYAYILFYSISLTRFTITSINTEIHTIVVKFLQRGKWIVWNTGEWWDKTKSFNIFSSQGYSTYSFKRNDQDVMVLMSILYGKEDTTNFYVNWTLTCQIIYEDGTIFNLLKLSPHEGVNLRHRNFNFSVKSDFSINTYQNFIYAINKAAKTKFKSVDTTIRMVKSFQQLLGLNLIQKSSLKIAITWHQPNINEICKYKLKHDKSAHHQPNFLLP